jgi:hypothetical protein
MEPARQAGAEGVEGLDGVLVTHLTYLQKLHVFAVASLLLQQPAPLPSCRPVALTVLPSASYTPPMPSPLVSVPRDPGWLEEGARR